MSSQYELDELAVSFLLKILENESKKIEAVRQSRGDLIVDNQILVINGETKTLNLKEVETLLMKLDYKFRFGGKPENENSSAPEFINQFTVNQTRNRLYGKWISQIKIFELLKLLLKLSRWRFFFIIVIALFSITGLFYYWFYDFRIKSCMEAFNYTRQQCESLYWLNIK